MNHPADQLQPRSQDIIFQMEHDPAIVKEHLIPHRPVEIDPLQQPDLDGAINNEIGVTQRLKAIISAADEDFAVIEARTRDVNGVIPNFVLARLAQPGQERATVVGVIKPGEILEVGRTMLEEKGFVGVRNTMSRKHFSFEATSDGTFEVTDLGSMNGTNILKRRVHEPGNPPGDGRWMNQWSPRSALVAEELKLARIIVSPSQETRVAGKLVVDLAADEAGESGVENSQHSRLEKRLNELKEDLEVDDRINLRWYADTLMDKRSAQKEGDGEKSIYFGQKSSQVYRLLSDEAKARAKEFALIYAQLKA